MADSGKTILFLGAGNMTGAIVAGLLRSGYRKDLLLALDPSEQARSDIEAHMGIQTCVSVESVPEVCVLAVKPQMVDQALQQLPETPQLLVSVAAGIRIDYLRQAAPLPSVLFRAMPNTPAAIGAAATALTHSENASLSDIAFVRSLFESIGSCHLVDESQMDAVTALSGSGPAYFFWFAQALTEIGAEMGLSKQLCRELVNQTGAGAMQMLQQSSSDAASLRQKVTSPGGTTQAALELIEQSDLREILRQALFAAQHRSQQLAK